MTPDRTILHLFKQKSQTSISLSRIMACTLLSLSYAPAELTSANVEEWRRFPQERPRILVRGINRRVR